MKEVHFKVGTRSSELARIQTRNALDRLESELPDCRFEDVTFTSPGDRDLETDLRESPADFFTRDLDEKVLSGELDCAVHSAKDVPDPVCEGLDWFWLPWREDPRDVLILAPGKQVADLPEDPRIGVSSDRREAYCLKRFSQGQQIPIRGNIGERLQQLDDGDYDLVVMASAALIRLGLEDRITEWISVEELPPPDGQGFLCVTFRQGDARFNRIRSLFVKAVTFAGGGVGSSGTCTLDVLKAVQRCDVCLHDALMGQELLGELPADAQVFHVGKRCGRHSLPQPEITELISRYARRGLRVVRLKGGDPGVFGRLAEEVDHLETLGLPYRALPGVSSLVAASTGTGMLLTRRGLSRGFCAMTPREAGGGVGGIGPTERQQLPIVFYMSVSVTGRIAEELVAEGQSAETPAAVVFGAGSDEMYVVSGTLADIGEKVGARKHELPGALIVGDVAGYRYRTELGALQGRMVLLTCSHALIEKASGYVTDFGGVPVCRPLIELIATSEAREHLERIEDYDWVVLTSPSAVRCFGELLREARVDLRRVPKLVTCGGGTSAELERFGFKADIEPDAHFSAQGMMMAVSELATPETRVLRLRSDKAGSALADAMREQGAVVEDVILYSNEPVAYESAPPFDSVFFASASAVEVFVDLWGSELLEDKTVVAIGIPTVAALEQRGVDVDVVGREATVPGAMEELARQMVRDELER